MYILLITNHGTIVRSSLGVLQVIDRVGVDLEVRLASKIKGKGVFARKAIAEDNVIFEEPALVGAQHTANRADALVCSRCFTFIGSIGMQIAHRLLSMRSEGLGLHPSFACLCSATLSMDLSCLWSGVAELPHSDRYPLPKLVTCLGGCTDTVYCSEECAAANWAAHHRLLCSGPRSQPSRISADAIRRFKEHADETNDAFHIAAQVVAGTLLRAEELLSNGFAPEAAGSSSERNWAALQRAWRPYAAAWKAHWWECVAIPDDVTDAACFRSDLHELAGDSLELLKEFLYDERFPALFHLDVYGSIMGIFELNNLGIYVASPVEDYFELCHAEDGGLSEEEQKLTHLITRPLLDSLGESYGAGCEGSAFYALQSCCNHSCAPNAHAFKRAHIDTDGSATILARKPIAPGEEVCLSYIDEDAPYHDRRAALADYGFTCECDKCVSEAAAPGKATA
ncbi:SET domain-containing protein [Coccomyxa subellipsoidea C-169]|uniref:SET domain-containing protein n=1 Tax=Coccomyxa subellipsoidea (strain C-169) TaxID=574566 RepID=I0YQW1_COCSC|nr:SET domain-containing protein [Coccomyxa subellipsoidea C-169]EIE20780.1 SET domain-containing protein [Coccomyxa subellipsoidea C-169]|eukprot:XP_005645324.1 SET domain-containing protein [Coccomyxa subellipsoidea C-169]